jgi:hypothetical protein
LDVIFERFGSKIGFNGRGMRKQCDCWEEVIHWWADWNFLVWKMSDFNVGNKLYLLLTKSRGNFSCFAIK